MSSNGIGSGNGNGNGNGNGLIIPKPVLSLFRKIFNISRSELGRVSECWLFALLFKIGAIMGWTITTALFVSKFGITFLPFLLVIDALLTITGSFLISPLLNRLKKEVLMILVILSGVVILLLTPALFFAANEWVFFAALLISQSFILAQFYILIPLRVGDLFSPLESERTFPIIESAETLGGILGGAIVGFLSVTIPLLQFFYLWAIIIAIIVPVILLFDRYRAALPFFRIRKNEEPRKSPLTQLKTVFSEVKRIPFLQGLLVLVMLQWIFMNMLEVQYTKAIEQAVTNSAEPSLALSPANTAHAASPQEKNANAFARPEALAEMLGKLKMLFYSAAFLVQIVFASRLITSLGVVGSMLLHPVVMLMSLVGLFLKFGFLSSVISRMGFEVTYVIHKNAYFSSHYAFPQWIRDQAAEFLEGIIRPLGTILGMILLITLHFLLSGPTLTLAINICLFLIMGAMFFATIRLQEKYTQAPKQILMSPHASYPEKLTAVEILAQRGHRDAGTILIKQLRSGEDRIPVKMKIIETLGSLKAYHALPEILNELYHPDEEVRFSAAHALLQFRDLGIDFTSQAFSRYHVITTLKEVFQRETSPVVRSVIIRVFSILRASDIIPFLIDILRSSDPSLQTDCIAACSLFNDPAVKYYISPFLKSPHPFVKAHAATALWQFPSFRDEILVELRTMLLSPEREQKRASLMAFGELRLSSEKKQMQYFLTSDDHQLSFTAALGLAKMNEVEGFLVLAHHLLNGEDALFSEVKRELHMLPRPLRMQFRRTFSKLFSEYFHNLFTQNANTPFETWDPKLLLKIRHMYQLLDQHEELVELDRVLANGNSMR